jgi:hypothetical protein
MPEINFNGNEIGDVIDFLRDANGVKLQVHWDKIGDDKTAAVNLKLKGGVRFSTVLRLAFESVNDGRTPIQCTNENGTLVITTRKAAK